MQKAHHGHNWMPAMYISVFGILKDEAKKLGYALAVHGTASRDLDLILVPWVEKPRPHTEVLQAWVKVLGEDEGEEPYSSKGKKPHGRIAYTIPLGAGGYIDVSVIPIAGDDGGLQS